MSRFTPSTTRPSGHDGDWIPPPAGGGGGGDSSPDSLPDSTPNYGERLRRARMGLGVAMTPIVMLFISFTVVYLIRRFFGGDPGNSAPSRNWIPVRLPWSLLLANTGVLIASSVTIDLARRQITRESALAPLQSIPGISLGDEPKYPWLAITTILGLLFLGGQLIVWSRLSAAGFHLIGGTSVSFIYILTAMHGLHLAGGVVALLIANGAAMLHRPVETRRILVDVTSWYWHCMTVLWIYILALFAVAAQ
jgi:cytochrome c oxidase subunit III